MPAELIGTYFTLGDDEWLIPTDHCRGPWEAESCHAGPPAAMVARAMEHAMDKAGLSQRLVRITINLVRPVPMAGFRVHAQITRAGRSVTTLQASLVDSRGKERITATGLGMRGPLEQQLPRGPREPIAVLKDAKPGNFPISWAGHDLPSFVGSVATIYPPGETPNPGPTTAWMRAIPFLENEVATPFQRICPLADSGNAFSRNAEPSEMVFVNPDLTLMLHREPQGDWLGSQSVSRWESDGIGLADALLFDEIGPVGRALQTLLLTPQSPPMS